jgi:hypothetical protein
MATLDRDYDIAVVLDADNVMAKFLEKINAAFEYDFIRYKDIELQKYK